MTTILDAQLRQLFAPLNPIRVASRDGMSYLETWDVIAHLTRIFGPLNWDKEVKESELIFEEQRTGAKTGWDVAYRATVRLTVRTRALFSTLGELAYSVKVSEDVATGSAKNQPSRADAHDLALKSAVSDALKRAAKDLGNQLGLSLYDGGSLNSVVSASLAHPHLAEKAPEPEQSPEERRAATEAAQAPYRGNPDPSNPFPPLEEDGGAFDTTYEEGSGGVMAQPPLVLTASVVAITEPQKKALEKLHRVRELDIAATSFVRWHKAYTSLNKIEASTWLDELNGKAS